MTDVSPYSCPRCDRGLEPTDAALRCSGCKVDFPLIGGLPWLFAEPNAALGEWRGRYNFLARSLTADRQRYAAGLRKPGVVAATKQRLEMLDRAAAHHLEQLRQLLAPLAIDIDNAKLEAFLALRTRLPPDQGLMTYYPNIHRDWCWGEQENEASIGIVLETLGDREAGRTLVLGAGAGRLTYDFHQRSNARETYGLDFNPLLILLADRISRGETIELHEFPLAPIDLDNSAPLRQLKAPEPARDGLSFLFADVHRIPFPAKRFDTIITPWLVDIIPGEFSSFCAQINHLLDDGGVWINFGSLNFHQADPRSQLSPEECLELIEQQGFTAASHTNNEIPYMCSPA